MTTKIKTEVSSGKLKIGDDWNAITIIALSQNNPLKAIAEFVENSIDAKSENITIIRGKQGGDFYLKIIDDGEGVSDFRYVATHIGDSIKRQLKKDGIRGIQGEFGIGLLSFWTVGERLVMTSNCADGKSYKLNLLKNNPGYSITEVKPLFKSKGTELHIYPILSGLRQINGEKIQNYLASELRDRIGKNNVKIKIIDRTLKKEFDVEPRQFDGKLLHNLPLLRNPIGEIYYELYISTPSSDNKVGLYKNGTRVIESISKIDNLNCDPWNSNYLQGMISVDFLQLTPGTRDGIIYDDNFDSFCSSLEELSDHLIEIINEQRKADEEKISHNILSSLKKAFKEAFMLLPREEYSWLSIYSKKKGKKIDKNNDLTEEYFGEEVSDKKPLTNKDERDLFEIAGPLYKAVISPASSIIKVGESKKLRILAKDKKNKQIDYGLYIKWRITEGEGTLDSYEGEIVNFTAPNEPGVTVIKAEVVQENIICSADGIITITEELVKKDLDNEKSNDSILSKGLPSYTFLRRPGELWRSRYDKNNNIIIINNGHSDYIFASKINARKIRYIARLFAKELILDNFPEVSKDELLERMIELTLYIEENLK